MKMTIPSIQAVLGFTKLTPLELLQAATAIYIGTNGNTAFPNPTVDMAVLKADIDNFSSAITAALDGGKKALAERNRLAEVLIKDLRKLGKHVEVNCEEDMQTFLSSGFEARSVGRPSSSLVSAAIRSIDPGPNSGQFAVTPVAVPGAHAYEIRYGAIGAGGTPPSSWISQSVGTTRPPALLSGLTPGTSYAIQVRSLTGSVYSDWSDPVTRICI